MLFHTLGIQCAGFLMLMSITVLDLSIKSIQPVVLAFLGNKKPSPMDETRGFSLGFLSQNKQYEIEVPYAIYDRIVYSVGLGEQ